MIVKRRYEVGGLYKDFTNLDLVGSYAGEVKIFKYDEKWLRSVLRFKKYDNEVPPSYLCTEIYNVNHHVALKSLETLVIVPDKGIGDRVMDWFEKVAKI